MANEVEITVKSKDKTDFGPMKTKAKVEGGKAGDEAGTSFSSRVKKWFSKSGDDSSKGFGKSVKKWFTGEGGGLFTEIGKSGGTVFGSGLLGALKTPILGPLIVATLAAVVATVLPAVGAIAGGALVTGFGAGIAGLGIVFAAKSKVVGDTWRQTMGQLGADMPLLSKPFESTLVNIAGYFERTVDKFNPHLAKAFAKMAPVVDKFVDRAATSLEQLIPAIDPITDAFDAVLDSLGPALDSMIGDLSAGLSDLAASVRENPEALADMVRGIGEVTRTALQLITILNDVNGKFEDLTGGVSLVDATMEALEASLAPLITLFAGLEKGIGLVNALTHSMEADGNSMREAALDVGALAAQYQKTGGAAKGVIPPTQTAAEKTAELAKKAADARTKLEALVTSLFKLQNQFLTLSGAAIGVQAAIDQASAAAKDNGKTLDINTEKGRANRTALDSLAKAANDQTESMIRAGKSNLGTARTAETSRAAFVKVAMQMGLNKTQAQRLAAQLIAIPNVSREARLTANKVDLERKLAAAKKQLADPKLSATKRARLEASVKQLEGAAARAKAAIASVQGKSVYITAIVRQRGSIKAADPRLNNPGNWAGGPVMPGFATGGTPPKKFWAGEYGPEIVELSGGGVARVTPHGNSMRRLQNEAGGGVQEIRLVLEGRGDVGDFLIKMLQPAVRDRGGNLNVILAGQRS